MKIVLYSYDELHNPWCGGGGALREYTIHKVLSERHTISYFCGAYPNAKQHLDGKLTIIPLGLGLSYAISRISYALLASIRSIFQRADIYVYAFSIYAPVFTFALRPSRSVLLFYHLAEAEPFKKYRFFGIFPMLAERLAVSTGKNFITLTYEMADYITKKDCQKFAAPAFTGYDDSVNTLPSTDENFILYFGRLDIHMKGLDILLDAFETVAKEFTQYRLVLAGRGSDHDIVWINQRISKSPFASRIQLLRNVPTNTKQALFASATFVCMPSRFEGWCIAAIEAAACGKATIGTNIMGLRTAIQKDSTGLLVTSENRQELADAMKILITNIELRTKLGTQGRTYAAQFTWEKISLLQESLYEKIIHISNKNLRVVSNTL